MNPSSLQQIYAATTYWLLLTGSAFGLRIGKTSIEFEDWLNANSISSWAIITAANPYSQALSLTENEARNVLLLQHLHQLGFYQCYPAEGRPDEGEWSPEPGFFIPNIKLPQALEIATQFEQNAIVFGNVSETPQVVWAKNLMEDEPEIAVA